MLSVQNPPTVAAIFILTLLRVRSIRKCSYIKYCILLITYTYVHTYIICVCTAKQEKEAYLVSGDAKEQGRISGCYIH